MTLHINDMIAGRIYKLENSINFSGIWIPRDEHVYYLEAPKFYTCLKFHPPNYYAKFLVLSGKHTGKIVYRHLCKDIKNVLVFETSNFILALNKVKL